jgi:CRP/FNR family transcriptional regulator
MNVTDCVPAFRSLSEDRRDLLEKGALVDNFPGGKTIIEKGQDVSGAYFVLSGQLRVFTYTPGGKEATLYFLDPGETCILALNSLFNDLAYPAWVETEADTKVAVVPGPLYRTLFENEKTVQDLTVHTLSTLVFRLMGELEQVHSLTLDQRLAGYLLASASPAGVLIKTQAEIAGHIGTTREVVARLMGRLAAKGWISTGRGEVRIIDSARLTALAQT